MGCLSTLSYGLASLHLALVEEIEGECGAPFE